MEKIKYFLVFFYVLLSQSCMEEARSIWPEVQYEGERAVAVSFNADAEKGTPMVYLSGENTTPVLGQLLGGEESYTFRPGIPFTAGLSYVIRQQGDSIMGFSIPDTLGDVSVPVLLQIHPLHDTVPRNLLKVYLIFSEPMQEVGKALDYITVVDLKDEKEVDVFLDMEAELWDRDHRQLTLWLDPGRIKTNLIPNQTLGIPLMEGREYQLILSGKFRSAKGIPLGREYKKSFYVGPRKDSRLAVESWEIQPPAAGGKEELKLRFKQALDLVMAREGAIVLDHANQPLKGKWELLEGAPAIVFTPETKWKEGTYHIIINAKLEDLAGNTVNRLFDRNVAKPEGKSTEVTEIRKRFVIRN